MLILNNLVRVEIFSRYKYDESDNIANFSTRGLISTI